MRPRALTRGLVLGAACVLLWSCAMPEMLSPMTTGEKYRQVLAEIDAWCKKMKIGPYLDPADPGYRSKASLTDCEVLKVKPFDMSAVLATEEGRFAYSIKLPAPLDKPQVMYTKDMSAEEYFKALCDKESGDFIFATVKNVDRVRQLRTSPARGRYSLGSYSEEGLSVAAYSNPGAVFVAPTTGPYLYLEAPNAAAQGERDPSLPYRLYFRDPTAKQDYPDYGVSSRPVEKAVARYAFVWRGVHREGARDLGIWGGELIILDLVDMKTLAVRREFSLDSVNVRIRDRVDHSSRGCQRNFDEGVNFVTRVVGPAR